MKTAIVGGGAAGFFCAIELKRLVPQMDVTILERQNKVLAKVEISGGGRCNCTNSFDGVTDLKQVYPRGASLLKHLFKQFGPEDAYRWFEDHGVPLVTQDDHCVFPQAQDSHAIIDCFLREAHRLGVRIRLGHRVSDVRLLLDDYDHVVLATGGISGSHPFTSGVDEADAASVASILASTTTPCVPSLFTFTIHDEALHRLMGTVVEGAIASIPGTKFRSHDPLLITHWGMSGPAILKLSSHAAVHLSQHGYQSPLLINWTGITNADEVVGQLQSVASAHPQKLLTGYRPFNLQQRLWDYLVGKLGRNCKWSELGKKGINRLADLLTNDHYLIEGRAPFKDEFVTCGGIDLASIDRHTLESRHIPNLYFAGELLDIDGVTGGFNFQAAWTTAHAVAHAIERKVKR